MQRLFPTFGPAGCTFLVPALISPKVSAACAAHFFFHVVLLRSKSWPIFSLSLFCSCFEGYAESDNECPICAPENRWEQFSVVGLKGSWKNILIYGLYWKRTWELPEQLTCFWKFTLWPFFLRLKVRVDLNFEIKVGSVFSFWEVFKHRLSSGIKESIFFQWFAKRCKAGRWKEDRRMNC